jgi:acetyl esterase/lipase
MKKKPWTVWMLVMCLCLAPAALAQQDQEEEDESWPNFVVNEDEVDVQWDVTFLEVDGMQIKCDIYLPKQPIAKPTPCIVMIHGGGWVGGIKELLKPQSAYFAERGLAAVSINYRLLDDAPFPACIEDCKAGVRWVRANAKKYGLDPDRLGVLGGSAGGHLSAMVAASSKEKRLTVGDHRDVSSRVQAAVIMAPVVSCYTSMQHQRVTDIEMADLISPIRYVDKDTPPTLLFHSEGDPIVPYRQARLWNYLCRQKGVDIEFITYEGDAHAFWELPFEYVDVVRRSYDFFCKNLAVEPRSEKRTAAQLQEEWRKRRSED